MDVAMEQVTRPTPENEVKPGVGTKVVVTLGPSVRAVLRLLPGGTACVCAACELDMYRVR